MNQIADYVGFQLIQVLKLHRQRAEEGLQALGLHTGQEMTMLQLWGKDGLTQSELGQCMGVEPPTVSKMLDRMERSGLIQRRQDLDDARVSRVYLTERGRALERPVLDVWRRLEERTVAGLTPAEQLLLRRLVMQLRANLA
mgnify:CR=1 FL=1